MDLHVSHQILGKAKVSSLDTWTGELERALHHPECKLYLTVRLLGILTAGNHVYGGSTKRVVAKHDFFPSHRLSRNVC